jgi:hypothetical protein
VLLIGGGAVVVLAAASYRRVAETPPGAGEEAAPPPGWYSFDVRGIATHAAEQRARGLSLPYARAGHSAVASSGVRRHRPDRMAPGDNLYVSAHGPEALLIDAGGRLLWRWRHPFERAFPGLAPTADSSFWRRVRPLPEGDLLVLVQGAGILRLDRHSRVSWRSPMPAYNDLSALEDGRVLTLTKEAGRLAALPARGEVLEDFLVELDAAGRQRSRVSILRALLASPWTEWVPRQGAGADLLHTNTVQPLDGSHAARHPAFGAGNVLLSLREIDALAVIDPRTGTMPWALRGSWKRQHQPLLLPTGDLALFDNRGGKDGGSRVLVIDPLDGAERWQYPPAGEPPLRSEQAGSLQLLANGNLLVVESQSGRAFELAPDGEIVWELLSPHRAGGRGELVAYLLDVLRVPPGSWLAASARERGVP